MPLGWWGTFGNCGGRQNTGFGVSQLRQSECSSGTISVADLGNQLKLLADKGPIANTGGSIL